ncbi:NAD-dependent epimerase [Azomonas macrocytogenes]|uniref:UDP-glucuronate 4-epimerase n=1 Tax=Azomonas macrocytogenes TaxID=69962 RepID=A0A839T1I4_AZOMA|nr:NAD-dependent epimerase [Azomonas macrocytogenes]MBB3102968.1 UDP-glucuronate 4-epimerase [Azomonas macrocytogenes]
MNVLVTGVAGFIGFHVARLLLQRGDTVVGIDNVNDYYDRNLKRSRLALLELIAGKDKDAGAFHFIEADIADSAAVDDAFGRLPFDRVIHLAAQAGIRYSLENPRAYMQSNLVGFTHILEACRDHEIAHLVYASTSSVYGANTSMPFKEEHRADHPLQFYAATKRANELMAHSYSHLFDLPTTGLRFFTVYGPWGRPDMALFRFVDRIYKGETIEVYNYGDHFRDFTYIDDIVTGILLATDNIARPDPAWDSANPNPATSHKPYRLFNIGCGSPVKLSEYIGVIEKCLNKKANARYLPRQPGDVHGTFADCSRLQDAFGYQPSISVELGVSRYIEWYLDYYVKRMELQTYLLR